MTDLATYLANLKAGDVVTVWSSGMVGTQTVTKVTPAQIVTAVAKYRKTDPTRAGWMVCRVSGFYQAPRIVTPREAQLYRLGEIERVLRREVTLDTIPAMRAALDRAEAALREGEQ